MELRLPDEIKVTQTPSSALSLKLLSARLSTVMFLQFIVFGAWFATLGLVLASNGLADIIGSAYFYSAIAAILSPLVLGSIGDRYLAPKYVLSLAHLVGATLLCVIPSAVVAGDATLTLVLIFAYMLSFQPTLSMVNSIALVALGDHQRYFPYVRLFGPLGWVFAGLVVGFCGFSASTNVFYVAAAAAAGLSLYALTLPYSAPPAVGAKFSLADALGVKAFVLFKDRRFSVLMLCILLTSISLSFYNTFASPYLSALGVENVAGTLTIGQLSEVIFIVTIPWVLAKVGIKWVFFIGMAMWSLRFALFIAAAFTDQIFAIGGVALHGICNDYFIVVAAMFIAQLAPKEMAAQAQGWLILMVSGFGAAFGSSIAGKLYVANVLPAPELGAQAWVQVWLVPIVLAIITSALWAQLYPSQKKAPGADTISKSEPVVES